MKLNSFLVLTLILFGLLPVKYFVGQIFFNSSLFQYLNLRVESEIEFFRNSVFKSFRKSLTKVFDYLVYGQFFHLSYLVGFFKICY